jgi:hypothetical protein
LRKAERLGVKLGVPQAAPIDNPVYQQVDHALSAARSRRLPILSSRRCRSSLARLNPYSANNRILNRLPRLPGSAICCRSKYTRDLARERYTPGEPHGGRSRSAR